MATITLVERPVASPLGHASKRRGGSPERRQLDRHFALRVALGMAVSFAVIWLLQDLLWGRGRVPTTWLELLVVATSVSWVLAFPSAVLGTVGLVMYGRRPRPTASAVRNTVSFRIVSRGQNADALRGTIASIRGAVAGQPLFPYRIEVVTDIPVELGDGPDLVHYVVPPDYQTPNRSKYKARALEYALHASDLPDDAWLMHLDEESHATPSLVRGIAIAVREEEASGELRIGQGAILYHRDLGSEGFLTLADSIRTGDDLGRFYFQHRVGQTIFGLHGSFILVRNDVEKEVGFDFGPKGSITEDAFWAVVQMQNGRRCRWVDGFIIEQATRSLKDFIMQRRRWFIGLVLVALHAPVRWRYRAAIGVSTILWSVSWVGVLVTYVNLVVGVEIPLPIRLTGDMAFAFYVMLYFLGIRLQLHYDGGLGRLHRVGHYAATIILIPVFSVLEGLGVVYGLLRPDVDGFHVVEK